MEKPNRNAITSGKYRKPEIVVNSLIGLRINELQNIDAPRAKKYIKFQTLRFFF
jgi:hypothetical protein